MPFTLWMVNSSFSQKFKCHSIVACQQIIQINLWSWYLSIGIYRNICWWLLLVYSPSPVKGAYWICSNSSFIQYCDSKVVHQSCPSKLSLSVHGFFSVLLPIQLSLFQLLRRSFMLLKAIAKSKSTHIAIAFKSEKERQLLLSQ